MKKSLVLLLLSSLVSGLYARQPRTVVEPPFAFRNSGTLEIERIELAPESKPISDLTTGYESARKPISAQAPKAKS